MLAAEKEPELAPPLVTARTAARNEAIDWLRGLVMVLMALDHTRSFVGSPVDLATADPAHFFARWITHYCAPVFVFLAGTAAYLHGRRLASTAALVRYLLTRGLWMIVLELTVVRAAWLFYLGPEVVILQVIWAIGVAMVALAGLVWLPHAAVTVFAVVVIAGHNLFDGVDASALGAGRWLWVLVHQGGPLAPFPGAHWFAIYPVLPWIAVMAAGYAFGPWAILPPAERRTRILGLGLALSFGFVVLRASGVYGDPDLWTPARGTLAFLDCEKYPPSLLFVAMTLGPALVLLAFMDRPLGPWERRVSIFGRVPLFYYVAHLVLIHTIAVAFLWPSVGGAAVAHQFMPEGGLGWSLPPIYALWVAVVVALYPPSAWFAGVKARSRSPWMSYL